MPYAEILGLRIHYHAPRDPGTRHGQRVLYVHGTGCNAAVWDDHMTAVADAHTPVAIDLPGHGRSEGRGFRGVADYAEFVIGLADALGWRRFVLAGHSLGGGIAITAALYHPERLAGLLLIDTGARLRVAPDLLRAARAAATNGAAPATDRSWAFASSTPQAVVDRLAALTAGTEPGVTYADWIADDTFDMMTRVAEITAPTAALCGAEDRLTPVKYHRYLQERIPGCRLTVIEGAGHWSFREQPEQFDRAVRDFLAGLPTG
ncbi:MAG TPA: alpha/beta hydrolase [Candidatus Bathyarchaeia archaeon]|nr:alpha/beta hydrolase [Candidatus Bathyarchaeia archaeon]